MNANREKRRVVRVEVTFRIEAPPPPRRLWNPEKEEYRLDVRRATQGEHSMLAPPANGKKGPGVMNPAAPI